MQCISYTYIHEELLCLSALHLAGKPGGVFWRRGGRGGSQEGAVGLTGHPHNTTAGH